MKDGSACGFVDVRMIDLGWARAETVGRMGCDGVVDLSSDDPTWREGRGGCSSGWRLMRGNDGRMQMRQMWRLLSTFWFEAPLDVFETMELNV